MEGAGHVQAYGADLAFGRERLRAFDRRDAAADHHLLRRVLVRDEQDVALARLVAQDGGVLPSDTQERRHRARPSVTCGLHRPAAHGHDAQRICEFHDLGGHQRRELAE
jgi:hypothetical protein